MMSPQKIYLAGPEVFLADAVAVGARKKILCEKFGFVGLFPLDNEFFGENIDEKIFAANVALMRQADAGIFNLSPFRGVNADPGTAFELGYFTALAKPTFAYTHHADDHFDRVSKSFGVHAMPGGQHCDASGLLIENFGNADNLMLDAALKAQRRAIQRPTSPRPDDFAGFCDCLRQARLHFGF
jgi:nucleoside 2-deoxyribosyltransferase